MLAPQLLSDAVSPAFHFHELSGMPCGCVTAAYRSFDWGMAMVSLEAKGPHCVLPGHEMGRVLEMSDMYADDDPEDDLEAGLRSRVLAGP